ncbi:MAG: ABC transporter permease [Alphaproteobacteria bacterium]|nr:ABC transporter permease [Alphaproteobacteria bacterium]
MIAYLTRRLLVLLATLAVASLVVFAVLDLLPGDPARLMLGIDAPAESVARLRHDLGLDRPALSRYGAWLAGVVVGDFGTSHTYRVAVGGLIAERLVVTLPLAGLAMTLTVVLALPLGVYAAARHNRPADVAVMVLSQIGISVPGFWLAILLILAFAVGLGWFPAGGFPGWGTPLAALQALALPAVALALAQTAILTRVTRAAMLEVMGEGFIRTAYAKGASARRVLWRHAFGNALVPVVTVMGLQLGFLVSGAVVIENVSYLPGLGRLVLQAVEQRDLIVVRGCVLVLVAMVAAIAFLVDLAYAVIDPRLRAAP